MTALEATLQLIKEEPSIETLLGHFIDPSTGAETAFPMVLIGTFPKKQKNLPAISIRRLNSDSRGSVRVNRITVSCYAETENESQALADAVDNFFKDSQGGVDGFAGRFDSTIISSGNDSDQTGTIVELTVTSR